MQVTEPLPYRIEPVLGFMGGDFYLRQTLRGNILFGSGQGRATADILRSRPLPETMRRGAEIAIDFIPALAHVPIIRSWTGVDGDTSDGVCVLGASETHPGLFHAFGFNGHGFLLGPAVGAVLTRIDPRGKTETDISGLGIGRFRPPRRNQLRRRTTSIQTKMPRQAPKRGHTRDRTRLRRWRSRSRKRPRHEHTAERSQEP